MRLVFAYVAALFRRKGKLILALLGIFIFLLIGAWQFKNNLVKNTLVQGVVGTYQEKDFPVQLTHLVSEPLISLDKSGLPRKNLVENWEVNSNATEYKFFLKKDLYWTDGTKVKSSDIALMIPDVEISYPDDDTIFFKIADSFSPFPTLLTKPILKKDTQIGIGPYEIKQVKKDGLFASRVHLSPKDKQLPEITIKFYPSEKIARTALKLGEIETLLGLNEVGDLNGNNNIHVLSNTNYEQLVTIFYNTQDPILSDENFRLALSFLAPTIPGEIEAKTSLPTHSWAFNPEVKDYLENIDQGKVSLGKVKNGKDSTITLTATSSLAHIGERVVESWNRNGIKAVLRVESGIPQNFQALLITQNIPLDPDQYSLWHSTQQGTNISKYSSPRVDKDLEDGRKMTDLEGRKGKYQDFQKVLLDHAPATFLYYPKYNVAYLKKSEEKLNKVIKLQLPGFEN
jgi:peptide/nickel transport system substrate-binding protein